MITTKSPASTAYPRKKDMDLMKRSIPVQARRWVATPSPALLDSCLRGNDRERFQSFLVTPLCSAPCIVALCDIFKMADQISRTNLSCFLRIDGSHRYICAMTRIENNILCTRKSTWFGFFLSIWGAGKKVNLTIIDDNTSALTFFVSRAFFCHFQAQHKSS